MYSRRLELLLNNKIITEDMILTGKEILNQVQSGCITIDPFDPKAINPNSYNYRIGTHYVKAMGNISCDLPNSKSILAEIPFNGLIIHPGEVILSSTLEKIGSEQFVTSLIGRSSVGRLGLFLQISADLGHLGPAHKWTLELTSVQSIIIYPRMIIGQVSFWVTTGDKFLYDGKYTDYNSPQECLDKDIIGLRNDSHRQRDCEASKRRKNSD